MSPTFPHGTRLRARFLCQEVFDVRSVTEMHIAYFLLLWKESERQSTQKSSRWSVQQLDTADVVVSILIIVIFVCRLGGRFVGGFPGHFPAGCVWQVQLHHQVTNSVAIFTHPAPQNDVFEKSRRIYTKSLKHSILFWAAGSVEGWPVDCRVALSLGTIALIFRCSMWGL